LVNLLIYLLNN